MKAGQPNFIERYFEIRSSGSTIRTEILAGLTTFFAMSYILFINPSVLAKAGMEWGAVFLATIIASVKGIHTQANCRNDGYVLYKCETHTHKGAFHASALYAQFRP